MCCISNATAQSVQQIEQDILAHLQHIQYWRFEYAAEDTSFSGEVNQEDSIRNANKLLLDYLVNTGKNKPEMLKADLKMPENSDFKIVNSDDRKFRIYCWDVQAGLQNHYYNVVAQYEANNETGTSIINQVPDNITDATPTGANYVSVYAVSGNGGKKYYMPFYSNLGVNVTKGIAAYAIDGGLNRVNLYRVGDKMMDAIEYHYDQSANYDFKKMKERYTIHIEKQKLYVPVMDGLQVTGKWLVYSWNGEQFVSDKNEN